MNKGHNTILFFLIVAIAFTFNFKANFYRSAADGFFNYFQLDGESLVIGRLLLTNEKGFTEHAGFLGWTHPEPNVTKIDDKFAISSLRLRGTKQEAIQFYGLSGLLRALPSQ